MDGWHAIIQEHIAQRQRELQMPKVYVSLEDARAGADPLWAHPDKVHDWRNHVPEAVQAIWGTFTAEQRIALVDWAEGLAEREEWD
ncbi:hypothetical protein [Methylobacterium sp. yr596]|uniref:hypothetical protein n=1 Tax=Methylobacterium sp. yr596 TaxID=1761800 RepID=UPI0008E3C1D7|nr:hypothetical protein [Methylobacterium sp. yr596]SFF17074.1 hypothetical protein SAMN04487844_1117 [Methylobacterium sp. yr596]